MPLGRPRRAGTEAERAAARRRQVRENVRAFRQRNRERIQLGRQISSSESGNDSQSGLEPPLASETNPSVPAIAPRGHSSGKITSRSITITSQSVERGVKWTLAVPFRVDLGPIYTDAFIAAFHYRSVSEAKTVNEAGELEIHVEENQLSRRASHASTITTPTSEPPVTGTDCVTRVEICFSTWTTGVTFESMSPGSEMLRQALLSAVLNLVGMEKEDQSMTLQAVQIQGIALRKLREGFDEYVKNGGPEKAMLLSATALACSMSELLVNKSWEGFALHLQGVGALIEHAGPSALNTDTARSHFYGYRQVWIAFSFLKRQSSFLSRSEFTKLEWRNQHPFNHPAHDLLDIAYQVPHLLEQYDETSNQSQSSIRQQLTKIEKLDSQLEAWKENLFEKYSISKDSLEGESWTPSSKFKPTFPNHTTSISFTLYTGVCISLFSLSRQQAEDLKKDDESMMTILKHWLQEMLKWSRIACQCLDYFLERDPIVVGNVACLFSFDAAWSAFVELNDKYDDDLVEEIRWCQVTAKRIEATGLPVFGVRSSI